MKINRILCIAAILATLCSCGKSNKFTINGAVDSRLNGMTVYLANHDDQMNPVDSAIVADGLFSFSGDVSEPWLAVLRTDDEVMAELIVEPGTITVGTDSIGGTPLNDRMMAFISGFSLTDIESQMEEYFPLYYNAPNAQARAEAERVLDSLDAIRVKRTLDACWALYRENDDNPLGLWAMRTIVQNGDFNYSQLDSIMNTANPIVANNKYIQQKLEQLRCVDNTSAGKHYTDIEGMDGKLSDLIDGKLALVDFYASWCGPCRAEIKDNLVPLWKKYQKKGLVIVGLNVWERGDAEARKAAHEKVMSDLGITYPQLVDSTLTATDTYGVQYIPQIILIDKDGTILARDLRGSAIEEAIIKALTK